MNNEPDLTFTEPMNIHVHWTLHLHFAKKNKENVKVEVRRIMQLFSTSQFIRFENIALL